MRSASAASILRPVSSMSFECAAPTSRGSNQLAPSSVLVRPFTIPVALNSADSPAIRSSAASDRHMPPPYATPLIAASTGCGIRRIVMINRE